MEKFTQFAMIVLMLNLFAALFGSINLFNIDDIIDPINSTESIEITATDANIQKTNKSFSYKIENWAKDEDDNIAKYLTQGVQDTNQQYLQAGGDFVKGLFIFYEVILKGMVLITPTLANFKVPGQLHVFFVIPIWFIYALGIIEFVSGRQTGG